MYPLGDFYPPAAKDWSYSGQGIRGGHQQQGSESMKYAGVVIRRNACRRGNRWIPANDEQYPQAQRLEMLRRSPAYRITQGSRPALKEGGTANARLHSSILRVMTSEPTCSQQSQLRSRTRTHRLIEVQASEKQSASMHSSSRPRAFNALRSKVAGVHSDEVVRHDSQHGKTPEGVRKVVQLRVVDHCYKSSRRVSPEKISAEQSKHAPRSVLGRRRARSWSPPG